MMRKKKKKAPGKKRLLSNLLSNQNNETWSVEPQLQLTAPIHAHSNDMGHKARVTLLCELAFNTDRRKLLKKLCRKLEPGKHTRVAGRPPQEGKS